MNMSHSGAIVPLVYDRETDAEYARKFRRLADDIESGRVRIRRMEIMKAAKGGPDWHVTIDMIDFRKVPA